MAVAIKSVTLSLAKAVSPRTPKFSLQSQIKQYVEHPSTEKNGRRENESNMLKAKSRKRLDYLDTIQTNSKGIHLEVENVPKSPNHNRIKENIQNLLINTPVKKYLVKNGLSVKRTPAVVLGRGSFGTVVKGFYKDTLVAVKVVKLKKFSTIISDINAKELSHKNIVNILEINMKPEENHAVIIMEYKEGTKQLQTLLETNIELDLKRKSKFIGDICSGLKYCHDHGILHLDIKPKNILVIANNECKICDFGNSCGINNIGNYEFQGTAAYAAPELLKGMKPTTKCDIYSLGITIWQIEYRESPYSEWLSTESLIYNVVKHHVRPKHKQANDIMTQLFKRCWHKDSACRPDSPEILNMLGDVR